MAIRKAHTTRTIFGGLALALTLCPQAMASPLEANKTYGCVVEEAHALLAEGNKTMMWGNAPKSFSLIEKSCFKPKDKPDAFVPFNCAAGHFNYLEIGPRDVVIQSFGGSELLFSSDANDKVYTNAFRLPVSLSFFSETHVMVSTHDFSGDDAAVFRLTANCFPLGASE